MENNMNEIINAAALAHTSPDGREQTLADHLNGVSRLAGSFADSFKAGERAKLIGLLHDVGKFSPQFQTYLREGGRRGSVDHSTAGAKMIFAKDKAAAFCIAGHHGGLPDLGSRVDTANDSTLCARTRADHEIPEYSSELTDKLAQQIEAMQAQPNMADKFSDMMFIRLLFSCLVDADYLDTESFMQPETVRGNSFASLDELRQRLDAFTAKFEPPQNELNAKRCEILHSCVAAGEQQEAGLFSLTVPTGGGKTIASLAFALHHACKQGMKRIIYVIPYTSIIEQNAAVFADIVGTENVVEHHMNAEYDVDREQLDAEQAKLQLRRQLATENWDAPLIVTTNVQFFESLFANKPSRCRKLHNIADSVIIFDEAQMLPVDFMRPVVRTIEELVKNYHCTALLCTATQPALNELFSHDLTIREVCDDVPSLFSFFRRTKLVMKGQLERVSLAAELREQQQMLCIVNTKRTARQLYEELQELDGVYHLSTNLCPKHRKAVLAEIRSRLQQGLSCRVVSTSLVEAGVDLDFPVVYRELAGLDSIIQAAGRCNREGHHPLAQSYVYIFELAETSSSSWLKRQRELTKDIYVEFPDITSEQAIEEYFLQLYILCGDRELDKKRIIDAVKSGTYSFREIAKRFILIDDQTSAVLVPYDEAGREIAEQLKAGQYSRRLLRQAGQYIVNVRSSALGSQKSEFAKLEATGCLQKLDEKGNISLLMDMSRYDAAKGLLPADEAEVLVF